MRGLVCAAVGSLALLIGCGGEDRDGTCRDGISFDGRTYWAAQSDAPVEFAGQLGTGTKPGCTEGPDGQDEDPDRDREGEPPGRRGTVRGDGQNECRAHRGRQPEDCQPGDVHSTFTAITSATIRVVPANIDNA